MHDSPVVNVFPAVKSVDIHKYEHTHTAVFNAQGACNTAVKVAGIV